jgi:hypothetical protein
MTYSACPLRMVSLLAWPPRRERLQVVCGCRVSSRGRPRGRSRARGSIFSAHSGITKRWSMKSALETLVEEKQFAAEQFSERARLFCLYGVERLEEELRCRELPGSRASIIELFMGEARSLCRQRLHEKLVRDGAVGSRVTERDMLRYVAVLILSHCWFLSDKKHRCFSLRGCFCNLFGQGKVYFYRYSCVLSKRKRRLRA